MQKRTNKPGMSNTDRGGFRGYGRGRGGRGRGRGAASFTPN